MGLGECFFPFPLFTRACCCSRLLCPPLSRARLVHDGCVWCDDGWRRWFGCASWETLGVLAWYDTTELPGLTDDLFLGMGFRR